MIPSASAEENHGEGPPSDGGGGAGPDPALPDPVFVVRFRELATGPSLALAFRMGHSGVPCGGHPKDHPQPSVRAAWAAASRATGTR